MRSLAAEGRTVLFSGHLLSEMENTADHLIVIKRGDLAADCTMAEFTARHHGRTIMVRTPQRDTLAWAMQVAGGTVAYTLDGHLQVKGIPAFRIGDISHVFGVRLHHLAPALSSADEAFTGPDSLLFTMDYGVL
jgi:ABC-2 type transport system ATP-binding protein